MAWQSTGIHQNTSAIKIFEFKIKGIRGLAFCMTFSHVATINRTPGCDTALLYTVLDHLTVKCRRVDVQHPCSFALVAVA